MLTIYNEEFKSIHQFLTVINNRPVNKVYEGENLSTEEGSKSFCKTSSYKEAEDLLTKGWNEPLEQLKKGTQNFKVTGTRERNKIATDVVGYQACVPRAILGLPDSMYNTKRVMQKVKTITLVYDIGALSNVDADDYIKAGIKILNIISMLESKGLKVSLDINFGAYKGGTKGKEEVVNARIKLKDFKDNLDIKKIAFPIAHPSMLRRIFFKWMERHPKMTNGGFRSGYGQSLYAISSNIKTSTLAKVLKKDEYYLSYTDVYKASVDDIIKNMKVT